MATMRAMEEPESRPGRTVACRQCKEECTLDELWILDECSCKYHKDCVAKFVMREIATSVTVKCSCGREISMRDLKELQPSSGGGGGMFESKSGAPKGAKPSADATSRLLAELQLIKNSSPEKSGFSVSLPQKKNFFIWEVKLFGFEGPLAEDMKRYKHESIVMEFTFPPDFPWSPPFCRVLRPRFQFLTGHVTVGGSVCTELLTNSGWKPQTSVESIIVSIRVELMAGNGRLDPANKKDYQMSEAKDAFERMRRKYNW